MRLFVTIFICCIFCLYDTIECLNNVFSQSGNEKLVKLLIENGANISLPNYEEKTPLHVAVSEGML